MKIRAGYEISYDCPQPTPMILTLSVHSSRIPDLLTPDQMRIDPPIAANIYQDGFGNTCHVIHAQPGRLTVSADLKTRITPCQFGGVPDCSQCGCVASMALAAVGHYRVLPGVTAGQLFAISELIGRV